LTFTNFEINLEFFVFRIYFQILGKIYIEIDFLDLCLIPQVYNANRFGVNMEQFPNICRIMKNLDKVEEIKVAHPSEQPDAKN